MQLGTPNANNLCGEKEDTDKRPITLVDMACLTGGGCQTRRENMEVPVALFQTTQMLRIYSESDSNNYWVYGRSIERPELLRTVGSELVAKNKQLMHYP